MKIDIIKKNGKEINITTETFFRIVTWMMILCLIVQSFLYLQTKEVNMLGVAACIYSLLISCYFGYKRRKL